eukprot:3681158-Amphidinium_carterae.1
MVGFGGQSSHGFECGAVESPLNATKVGARLDDRRHDVAVTGGHHKVVGIIPTDVSSGGPKASGLGAPPEALAKR